MEDRKTRQQEKSYHVLFQQIADYCVAHSIDMKMVMEKMKKYRVQVTKDSVKATWRAILETQTGKESTTEQTKEDVKNVQREFEQLWFEITGERIDWPSVESQHFDEWYSRM